MTTLPHTDLHTDKLEMLQREILLVNTASVGEKKYLVEIIRTSHDLVTEINNVAKQNKALGRFLGTISGILLELYKVSQATQETPHHAKPREILQHLATTYQDSIVPILTRLHNLSQDTENMLRITSLASLGNEIITCSAQLYQFSDKIDTNEKNYAVLGTVLMYAGIGLAITILARYATDMQVLQALTCIALGYALAKTAMDYYKDLPEADLARTALSHIPTAIAKIEKAPQEQEYLDKIFFNNSNIIANDTPVIAQAPEPAQQETQLQSETPAQSLTLLQKIKTLVKFHK